VPEDVGDGQSAQANLTGYVGASTSGKRHVRKEAVMHVVVRSYSGQGASEVFDLLEQKEEDVKDLISGVPGFVSYAAFRTGEEAGMTVTVCQDEAGTEESSRRAAGFVKDNATAIGDPPTITEGDTVLQFNS
jgi:hypothetical protein